MPDSSRGIPKVTVSRENDMRLRPAGKMCAPAGLPNLPGGLMRAHSEPTMVLTCPGGWLHHHQEHKATLGREFRDRQRATASHNSDVVRAAAGGGTAVSSAARPTVPAAAGEALPGRAPGTAGARAAAGRGPLQAAEFDPRRHGWPDPRARPERARLSDPGLPGSWSRQIGKATDHNGYGADGRVDRADVQVTAVSGGAPAWFTGTRDLPGPRGTRQQPVRRCPHVSIEGRELRIRAKTYVLGEGMATLEVRHDRPTPPTPAGRQGHGHRAGHPAERCHLEMGGCQLTQQ